MNARRHSATTRAHIVLVGILISGGCVSAKARTGRAQLEAGREMAFQREVVLRRKLARRFTPQAALQLARTLLRQNRPTPAVRVLRFLLRTQPREGPLDLTARALLAEALFKARRLSDSAEVLIGVMTAYPSRRGWVEANLDFLTRSVAGRAASLQTTPDDRIALGLVAASGNYPGPALILAEVYDAQLNDARASRYYRLAAARAGRAIAAGDDTSPPVPLVKALKPFADSAIDCALRALQAVCGRSVPGGVGRL